jgi:glycerol-3-phosphate dehydrogenase (NAD(P)+)
MTDERVAVVGAGSWGTALALLLANAGRRVKLWSYEPEVVETIQGRHENSAYLPGVRLPVSLRATGDLGDAVTGAQVVVSVSPSQFVRRVMTEAAPHVSDEAVVVSASKGIEIATLERMDQVLTAALGPGLQDRLAVLSGPSFALEVARGQPTAVVVASASQDVASRVQRLFQTPLFRVYTNQDVVGVELGGALKNVIALASGTAAGLGFGHNARAALITRGLAEITRLGVTLGAQPSTFAGLAGLGDLILTCTGELSRNRTVGYRLGRGESLEAVLGHLTQVAEGVKTVQAVHALAMKHQVEMPITEEVYKMVVEGKGPLEAMQSLMAREPKPEESW